jgi:hypothetical protein
MPNFDEATRLAEELFAQEQANNEDVPPVQEEAPPVEEQPVEEDVSTEEPVPTNEEQPAENTATDEAIQMAEIAAQTAQEKDSQLQQVMSELEALKQQNQQLQGAIDEMSRQNEEELIEEAMMPPELDLNGLAFADEETQKAEMAKFVQAMTDYNREQMRKELAPELEYAKRGMLEAQKTEALEALSQDEMLSDIKEMLPQIERIISNNKWLQSDDMSIEEKYINAYAIARGVNAINTPPPEPQKELTDDDLMKLYDENPTFQELIEKKRIEAIKNSQQVPPFSASSGAVNAALNIDEKPKTFEEASERTRKMFGLD